MTAIKVAGMGYFNSILSNGLTIDTEDIRQTVFDEALVVLNFSKPQYHRIFAACNFFKFP